MQWLAPTTPWSWVRSVYEASCDVCKEVYIGETGRSLNERMEEHYTSLKDADQKLALCGLDLAAVSATHS